MNEATAIEIAKNKMQEQNVNDYVIRFRHIRLDSQEVRTISADNEWYIVAERSPFIIVKSKAGIYDFRDTALREIQHVHTGAMTVTNSINQSFTIKFIQLIPKRNKKTTKL
jgi:hypothetical protein